MGEQVVYLYRYYAADDRLLYVGITSNLSRRERQHHQKSWWSHARRREVLPCPSRVAAQAVEALEIHARRPTGNIAESLDGHVGLLYDLACELGHGMFVGEYALQLGLELDNSPLSQEVRRRHESRTRRRPWATPSPYHGPHRSATLPGDGPIDSRERQ